MNKKTSIKDIARIVGVSTASVSYVLNGKEKEAKIGKEIATKIRATAEKLNYQPNFFARSLQSGSTKMIGLILEDIANPFFSLVARIIEQEAQKIGYTVVIGCHYENAEKLEMLLTSLLLRQVDGIIISPVDHSETQLKKLQKAGMPYVLFDRYFPAVPSNAVTINNFDISYQAVSHLAEQGYKNIGMIAFASGFEHMNDRLKGYQQALKDHQLKQSKNTVLKVTFDDMQSGTDNAIYKMLIAKNRPDALLFANNVIGINALNVINQMGIKVPEEIGLICFDERDAFDFFYAPLTYIQQNLTEIGEQALRILMNLLKGKQDGISNIVVEARLIVRKSSIRHT